MNPHSGTQPKTNGLNRQVNAGRNRRRGGVLAPFACLVLAVGCTIPRSGSETLSLESREFMQASGIQAISVIADAKPGVRLNLSEPGSYHFRITATPTWQGARPREMLDRTVTIAAGSVQAVTLCPEQSGSGRLNYFLHCDFVSAAGSSSQFTQLYAADW